MSKRKLLLADDSITIQKVVNLTFADEGIEVISVGDGDSAMRKFDEFMPDLVMADVNMPGLNGYEVCSIIKHTDETRHIPVILLVGSFEPFDETQAKEAGADDFLTKPFQSIRQLVNKVTDLLNRKQSVPEMTPEETPPTDSFVETLEFNKPDEPATESDTRQEISDEFGDAGMDDEMIETSPANEYVSDSSDAYQTETPDDYAKTQPLNQEDLKDFDNVPLENVEEEETPPTSEPPTFEEEARKLDEIPVYEEATEERPEISETEPQIDYYLPEETEFKKELSGAETLEPEVSYSESEPREADFSEAPAEETTETEETGETAEEQPEAETSLAEETRLRETEEGAEAMPEAEIDLSGKGEWEEPSKTETETEETTGEAPFSAEKIVSPLNFDDGDLLELPPLVEETGIRPQSKSEALVPEVVTESLPEPESKITVTKKESEIALSFPPELIEAIAQKVAEKISAKTMSDILPQITELVMKKMAEDKKE